MEHAEHSGRERILGRIRAAVQTPAPKHATVEIVVPIFPAIPDLLARFQEECAFNVTECVLTKDSRSSAEALAKLMASISAGEIYVEDAPVLRRVTQMLAADRAIRWSREGAPSEGSQATVTLAECLVASTGSIFLSSAAAGRAASVVAPVHFVVASRDQLVADLAAAFSRMSRKDAVMRASCLFLVTGSSRTADIEKILVLGAHGPRRVVIILAETLD